MLEFGLAGVGVIFFGDGCVVRKLMHFCPLGISQHCNPLCCGSTVLCLAAVMKIGGQASYSRILDTGLKRELPSLTKDTAVLPSIK